MGQRVLLTGGGGFSGAVYAERLAAAGLSLTVHAGRSRGRLAADFEARTGASVVTGDLADLAPEGPLAGPFDAIVHAGATSAAPGVSVEAMIRANALGTRRIAALAEATGARTVVYFSSLSVYGDLRGPTVDETTPFIRPDAYGTSKYLGELALAEAGEAFGSLSIRLPGVLGPGSVRNFLTGVRAKAAVGEAIRFFGPDNPFNNAAHVDDLADFTLHLIARGVMGHDAVVVGAGGRTTVGDAVRIIAEGVGRGSRLDPRPAGERPVFLIDDTRARTVHGYAPMEIDAMLLKFAREAV